MTTAATISAKLILDSKDYDDGLGNAGKKATDFQSKMSNMGSAMMGVGTKMTLGLTAPILAAGGAMVMAASDLEESLNAVNVVFGESDKIIKDYGETVAETSGLSQSEFSQMAAVTGAFLKNVGFDTAAAAEETIKLTERASDMASIFNTDVSQALEAIQSGLKGEFNPLEQFGVKMNAAAIEARALSMGLVGTTQDLLKVREAEIKATEAQEKYRVALEKYGDESAEAAKAGLAHAKAQANLEKALEGNTDQITDAMKAQAALSLVMEQTDQFAGDFANTSDGLANSTKILKAQFTDQAAALGQQLLPLALKAVQFFGDLLSKFQALTPEQQKMILIVLAVVAAIGPLVTIVGGLISAFSAIIPIVTAIAGVLTFPLIAIIVAVGAAIALLVMAWKNNWGGIQETVQKAVTFIKLIITAFKSAMVGDWEKFGELMRIAWDFLWINMGNTLNIWGAKIREGVDKLVEGIKSFFADTDWEQVGKDILLGIANGIESLKGWALQKMLDFAMSMAEAFKGFFGISSDSKLMTEFGGNIVGGLMTGTEPMSDSLNSSLSNVDTTASKEQSSDLGSGLGINSIVQAIIEGVGSIPVSLSVEDDGNGLASFLKPKLDQENRRVGSNLISSGNIR